MMKAASYQVHGEKMKLRQARRMAGKAPRKAMAQTGQWTKEQERADQQWPYCVLLMVSAATLGRSFANVSKETGGVAAADS